MGIVDLTVELERRKAKMKQSYAEPNYEETWQTKTLSLLRLLAFLTLLSAAGGVILLIVLPILLWGAKGLLIQLGVVIFLVAVAKSISLIDRHFENIYIRQHGLEAANAYKQEFRRRHPPTAVP